MNRQALRTVYGRARPELEQTGVALKSYFQQFSTSQALTADDEGPKPDGNQPPHRQRARAAAAQINSLPKSRGDSAAGRPQGGSTDAPQPKVLDIRSLPRGGLRGGFRGGFRGRGGSPAAGQAVDGSASPTGVNRFAGMSRRPSTGPGASARGGRGRGGRGGRGRGGFRGRRRDGEEEDKDGKKGREKREAEAGMDHAMKKFDLAVRFGTKTSYNPSLTLESLNEFIPALPMGQAGQKATVMHNLQALGSGDHVATPQRLHARNLGNEVEQTGIRFFASIKEKEAAEQYLQEKRQQATAEAAAADGAKPPATPATEGTQEPIIKDAEEAIRKVVMGQSVKGQYEKITAASDPVGVSRLWHLRSETYSTKDIDSFEKKLASLVGNKGNKARQPQKRA